jgi:putative FmdB family regulatory protein
MPLYEYECDACGHRFEVIQKSADSPSGACPKCGGAVHKLQSAPAIQFKGSGFYITDYARKDQAASKSEKSDKSEKSESSSGEGTKTEGAKTDGAKSDTKESSAKADKGSDTTKSSAKTDT